MTKRKNSHAQRERMKKRNKAVSEGYLKLTRKHPQWRHDAIVEKLAEQFFLAPKTIDQIIRGDYERHFWKEEGERK